MTKKKGLTKAQSEKMRDYLLDRQRRLHADVKSQLEGSAIDGNDRGGDEADQATMSLNSDLAVDVRARESRELQLIEQALQKIDSGLYGSCEDCGNGISIPRLEALPFAQFCIDCQERNETEGSSMERREFQTLD